MNILQDVPVISGDYLPGAFTANKATSILIKGELIYLILLACQLSGRQFRSLMLCLCDIF